jgi:hypothetical protein
MTLVFMTLLACVISKGNESQFNRLVLALLVTCGVTSVFWWNITNDLRFYMLVQFGPLLVLIPALWFVRDARFLAGVLALYAVAKLAEFYDRAIFSGLPLSGHTVKHLLAGAATYLILRWRLRAASYIVNTTPPLGKSVEAVVN